MSDSLSFAGKEIYHFIKERRKTFYKFLFKRWGTQVYMADTRPSDDLMYKDNPTLGAELIIVYAFLHEHKCPHDFSFMELSMQDVWLKMRPRYIRYLTKKVSKQDGKFPIMIKTVVLKELLARGYMHQGDIPLDDKLWTYNWRIECYIGSLIYPEGFKEQKDAIEFMDKFGMPGFTGIKQVNR